MGAPLFRVFCERVGPGDLVPSCRRMNLQFRRWPFVHLHWACLARRVPAKAAPCPVLGLEHKAALHRIAVHVAQLLDALLLVSYVEAVEAALPNVVVFFPEPELR